MNPFKLTRVLALFILGFFFSCNTPKEYQTIANSINSKQFDIAINTANESIKKNPDNANLYYYKSFALNEKARTTKDVFKRKSIYKDLVTSLQVARNLYKKRELKSNVEDVETIEEEAWSREYNVATRVTEAIRAGKEGNWDNVYGASENALIIKPDSISVLAYLLEAAFNANYIVELDSLIDLNYRKASQFNWFKQYRLASLVHNKRYIEAKDFIEENSFLNEPNDMVAKVYAFEYDEIELLNSASLALKKSAPSLGYTHLMALTLWKTIETNRDVSNSVIDRLYKVYLPKENTILNDSIQIDQKSKLIDSMMEQLIDLPQDSTNTLFKARIFSNLGSIYTEITSDSLQVNSIQISEKAVYFYRKAVPEWVVLIYQLQYNPEDSALQLYHIYELLEEKEKAEELKKEFSFK